MYLHIFICISVRHNNNQGKWECQFEMGAQQGLEEGGEGREKWYNYILIKMYLKKLQMPAMSNPLHGVC